MRISMMLQMKINGLTINLVFTSFYIVSCQINLICKIKKVSILKKRDKKIKNHNLTKPFGRKNWIKLNKSWRKTKLIDSLCLKYPN